MTTNEITHQPRPKTIIISTPTGESNYFRQLYDNAQKPRHCTRETFSEGPAPGCVQGCWLKVWTFHYSDGTMEQLKRVIEK